MDTPVMVLWPSRSAGWTVLFGTLLISAVAEARNPEIASDKRQGVWIAAGEVFVNQQGERWSVFAAPDLVNAIAVDEETVWIASDDGVLRFESGSRRFSGLSMDDGLPSLAVTAVAVDEQFVWFGTNKGLARYRKIDRTIRVFTRDDGLPHRAINDIALVGRQVWVATRNGIAVYDPEVDGLRGYTQEDGLGGDYVSELFAVGEDLWCLTDAGLSRFIPQNLRFTNFSFVELGGEEIRVFAPDGERIWIGTENGLASFEATSDAFIPFPQLAALENKNIVGIEPFTDYLFIATDQEVVQYHKENRTFRRYTEADGIPREAGAEGMLLSGRLLTLLFNDGASVYDIQRDLWIWRSLEVTEKAGEEKAAPFSWQLGATADAEVPVDLSLGEPSDERFATGALSAGLGYQFEDNRSLELSVRVDYGEVELEGFRDSEVKGAYLGTNQDVVREVQVGDELKLQTLEEGVERQVMLSGVHARFATAGDQPTATVTVDAGLRRGVAERDFIVGAHEEIYTLSHRYILPGSERVYLDGELLTAGRDYTLIYPAGQLAFLDPERVDDLSVIEVEYEYDMLPKKGLGVISLLDLLPGDNEVGAWARSSEPIVISEESGLYAQINGAAPKYIDRGWVRSVYIEYRQGSRNIKLAIHDMGSEVNAGEIYDFDLPLAQEPVSGFPNMVLDIGLATAYAIKSYFGDFYIELSIDEKTDATRQSLKLFAIQVLEREASAGAYEADHPFEILTAARATVSPVTGLEIGARAIETVGIEDRDLAREARQQLNSMLDARYETAFGDGGRLTAYGEVAGSHDQKANSPPGWAAMGRLRVAHPSLEGSLALKHYDLGYSSLATRDALFGTLKDEARLVATAYPKKWLPTKIFFTRQHAAPDPDALDADDFLKSAVVQHAFARVQLSHKQAPATSLQVGHSMLDDAAGTETHRLKAVAQVDYDLATGILAPQGWRRFIVRGLYGFSEAQTDHADTGAVQNARVEVARAETKFAPSATETTYALFRWRRTLRFADADGDSSFFGDDYEPDTEHWELHAGARSAAIPGLIPQFNQSILFDAKRDAEAEAGETRSANTVISPQLGIFPGDWWGALTPISLVSRYSLSNKDEVVGELRTVGQRTHRVDNRISYNGMGTLRIDLFEIYEVGTTGEELEPDRRRLELRNRAIIRPIQKSPITLRFDFVDMELRNDLTLISEAPEWGHSTTYEGAGEWLMRWSPAFATRIKTVYSLSDVRDLLQVEESRPRLFTFEQHQISGLLEMRYLRQSAQSSLFVIGRGDLTYRFGAQEDAIQDWGFRVALGVIWTYSDKVQLDAEVAYRATLCLEEGCADSHELVPRLLMSAKL